MSADQCSKEFPLFYPQLHGNEVAWRKASSGGITQPLLQSAISHGGNGSAHLIISDGKLYIRSFKQGIQSRLTSVVHLFNLALQASRPEDWYLYQGAEFVVSVQDRDGYGSPKDAGHPGGFGNGAGWVLDKLVSDPAGQYLIVS